MFWAFPIAEPLGLADLDNFGFGNSFFFYATFKASCLNDAGTKFFISLNTNKIKSKWNCKTSTLTTKVAITAHSAKEVDWSCTSYSSSYLVLIKRRYLSRVNRIPLLRTSSSPRKSFLNTKTSEKIKLFFNFSTSILMPRQVQPFDIQQIKPMCEDLRTCTHVFLQATIYGIIQNYSAYKAEHDLANYRKRCNCLTRLT